MVSVLYSRFLIISGLVLVVNFSALAAEGMPGGAPSADKNAGMDMTAPVIDHQFRQKIRIAQGTPVEISAVVKDDDGVKAVTLYYRTVGGEEYTRDTMQAQEGGKYSVLIPAEGVSAPGLEYYIQAEDMVGNMSFKGATFSPIQLVVKGEAPHGATISVSGSDEDNASDSGLFAKDKKWWWVAGGVLVTGAIYAASQGNDNNKDSGSTSVTVTGRVPQ